MPFARPTLTTLRSQAAADIASTLTGDDALLRFSNLGVLGDVLSGMTNLHYGYLDWIARQSVPFTSTDEYLEAWAALKDVRRKAATAAIGPVALPGTNGAVVPSGTPLTRSDGFAYTSTADATVTGGVASVAVQAVTPGAAGNAATGVAMTLGVAVAGVTSTGATSAVLTGGADLETDDALRSRMLQAYAAPSQGGAQSDFIQWSLETPGVTRAWVESGGMGAGSVVIYFMMDLAEEAFGGFPQGSNGVASAETRDAPATGDQLALANALFDLQPVTALVYAVAPTPNNIGLTIAGISGAGAQIKSAASAAVAAALQANAVPGGVTNISTIEAAIAAVNGTAGFVLTLVTASAGTVTPGAAGNITSNAGHLPVLDAITYT